VKHDTELGNLSDDEPGRVMGTISKTVPQYMESFRHKQMRHDDLTQAEWGDPANYFSERGMKYGTAELIVPVVVNHQIDMIAATPSPTTFGNHMHNLQIVSGQLWMPAVTSRPGSSQMRLCLEKPQSH
jgi:hypothetical protein